MDISKQRKEKTWGNCLDRLNEEINVVGKKTAQGGGDSGLPRVSETSADKNEIRLVMRKRCDKTFLQWRRSRKGTEDINPKMMTKKRGKSGQKSGALVGG